MATSVNKTYVISKNSSSQWTTANPVLTLLEVGVERDTGFFKIGNGIHNWNTLPYVISAGARGLIIFASEDPDNLLAYGTDGGLKLASEYFNALADYAAGKASVSNTPVPTKMFNQVIFLVGKDIKDILLEVSNLKHRLDVLGASVTIDDTSTTAVTKTWSVAKIVDHVLQNKIDLKNDLLNNNAVAYEALQSLATYLATDPNMATAIAAELGSMVKFNAEQSLTTAEKAQVCTNIGAVPKSDLGDSIDLLASYNAKLGDSTGSIYKERKV